MTAEPPPSGFHLWLTPEREAMNLLQSVVEHLAKVHGGPVFVPHITLLSGLSGDEQTLIEKCRRLAEEVGQVHIELTAPEVGTSYFQCVYMGVVESHPVMQARQAAGEIFGLSKEGFLPHLSLYYGNNSREHRAKIMAAVPDNARCSFEVGAIELIRATSDRPSDWHCVERAPLITQGLSASS
ncbi:MAG: 2'-5' RNA ligase family protein [Xanthomonadales bacterium]|nr:2'-5' RNA ligase family protein [Xanthomonadales bacterium]